MFDTITEIENMTEKEALENAEDFMEYKGYNIYFINFKNVYGYSMVVFKNGKNIRHAHETQLIHSRYTEEELRKVYQKIAKAKLFENSDFDKVKEFYDYKQKKQYLIDIKPLEYDYISVFNNKAKEIDTSKLFFSGVCYGYFYSKDAVKEIANLKNKLDKNIVKDYKYYLDAFNYEISNHEYCYNMQANWDVFNAVFNKNLDYKGDELFSDEEVDNYIKQLKLNKEDAEMVKKAFNEALENYEENCEW